MARELERYSLMFLEDPIDPMDRKGLKILRDKSSTPIGIGELYTTINDCEKDGYLHMMDRRGIGVGFSEEAALQYPFQKKYLPILRDETGALHN